MSDFDRASRDEKSHRRFAHIYRLQGNVCRKIVRKLSPLSYRERPVTYEPLNDEESTQHPHGTYFDLRYHTNATPGVWQSHLRTLGLLAGLYLAAITFYLLSLQGARSPKEMNRRLSILGFYLVTSVTLLSAQLWTSLILLNTAHRLRKLNALLLVLTFAVWYLLDNGNRLDSHGAFNLLIFCIIFIPSNIIIGVFAVWYTYTSSKPEQRLRRFLLQLLGMAILIVSVVSFIARDKEHALAYGFFGRHIPCTAEERARGICDSCQWKSAIPWFDLLPIRLNIFTGPMSCPTERSLEALFDDAGNLNITCYTKETEVRSWFNGSVLLNHPGAVYAKLPRTELWGLPLKGDALDTEYNPLQQHVIRFAENNLTPYDGPVLIDDNTDTLLVFCGKLKPKILNRITGISGLESPPSKSDDNKTKRLNVVTLFIDAVSRRQLHRRLPETRRVLENIDSAPNTTSELFEFFRYHTVGLNTGPNTRALWAGLDEQDSHGPGTPLWEEYQHSGYASARVDPMCQDWTAYYDAGHFPNPNATYINKPSLSHEYLSWSCFPPYMPIGKHNSGNFAGATSIKARCISDTHVGWHELDWASSFISAYRRTNSKPFYINAAFMEGHEGSSEVLRTLDMRLARFLDPQTSPMDLNMTAIIILSDHGALMGLNNAFFENGKVEAANPAAVMLVPRWYTDNGEKGMNLRQATQRLVTAHDLYQTMKEFMSASSDAGNFVSSAYSQGSSTKLRGYNLFQQLVPDRSCVEAGITESACKCI